jgi:hypothetical protein
MEKPALRIHDPIDCFPYEIWTKCVCFAAYGEVQGPLPLLLVSKKWEKGIMETPEAWTSLVIDHKEDVIIKATTFMYLSRHCLVDLHIAYPYISWDCLKMVLDEHGAKIRAIIIRQSIDDIDTYRSLDKLLDVISSNIAAPNMEEFLVQRYAGHSSRYYFLCQCPRLVRALIYDKVTPFNADSIRDLSQTIKEIAAVVENLEDFELLGQRHNLTSPIIRNSLDSEAAEPFFNASCGRLQELWYTILNSGRADSFVNVYYPRMHTLRISLTSASILQVLESIHHFPELRHLDIEVLYGTPQDHPMVTIASNAPRLTSCILRCNSGVSVTEAARIIDTLADGLILGDSRVLEFVINHQAASIDLYKLLCKTPRVQILRLEGRFSQDASQESSLVLPNLEVLRVAGLDNFSYIQGPKLEKLTILPGIAEEENFPLQWTGDKLSSLRVDPRSFERLLKHLTAKRANDSFPSLQHIVWDNPMAREGYQTSLLRTVTTVEFNDPGAASTEGYINPLDALLLSLLQFPDSCPTLSTVKTRRYPCWDLLFTTLQERNANSTVVTLQTLSFPGYPPYLILEELVRALKGVQKSPTLPVFDPVIQRRIAYNPQYVVILHADTT